ncbi:fluoride efflux transporter FluC [Domibacillus epiphyticus]|uniref:fluoride efflux transporter FluC n=1 Tax=Domibacillus epiphyticus TaxID=1714355 RepID=UPI0009F90DBD|nr:CrcB family protein [Domibacillus epiphyticus]
MNVYLLVGIGGFIGAMLRYGISVMTEMWWYGSFPAATLFANYAGCFLLPYVSCKMGSFVPTNVQKAITSGIIGSFTTFSAFSVETIALFESGKIAVGLLYLSLSITGGLLFVRLGEGRGNSK